MIKFKCHNCGQGFKVSDEHAGKQTKCPKCNSTVVVPSSAAQQAPAEQSETIKFRCPSCNQKIGLAKQYAGKTVRCAKCKNPMQVPGAPRPAAPPKPPKPKHETEILRADRNMQLRRKVFGVIWVTWSLYGLLKKARRRQICRSGRLLSMDWGPMTLRLMIARCEAAGLIRTQSEKHRDEQK